jgi:hypothetical protein
MSKVLEETEEVPYLIAAPRKIGYLILDNFSDFLDYSDEDICSLISVIAWRSVFNT